MKKLFKILVVAVATFMFMAVLGVILYYGPSDDKIWLPGPISEKTMTQESAVSL